MRGGRQNPERSATRNLATDPIVHPHVNLPQRWGLPRSPCLDPGPDSASRFTHPRSRFAQWGQRAAAVSLGHGRGRELAEAVAVGAGEAAGVGEAPVGGDIG